jgi:hypothetical protein
VTWKKWRHWPALTLLAIAKLLNFDAVMTNRLAAKLAVLAGECSALEGEKWVWLRYRLRKALRK